MNGTVYQAKPDSCGYAATRSFLIYFTKQKGWRYLKRDHEGAYDLQELSFLAKQAGVNLIWKRSCYANCLEEAKRFPLLLLLNEGKDGHLVVLLKKRKEYFYLDDPAKGKYWIKGKELMKKWSLIFGEGYFDRKEIPPKRPKLIDYFTLPLLLSLLFLELVFFLIGFYFLEEDPRLLYAFSFFLTAFLLFLLREGAIFLFLNRFEKDHLFLVPERGNSEDYFLFQRYKGSVFLGPISSFASLLVSLCLFTYVSFFGFGYFLASCFILLLEICYFPLEHFFTKEKEKLERKEAKMLEEPFAYKKGAELSKTASKLAFSLRVFDLSSLLPLFGLSFLALWGNEQGSSFYGFISAFLSLFILSKTFRSFLQYFLQKKKRQALADAFFERFLSLS